MLPLGEALSSPDALADLLDDLGWEVQDLVPNIGLDPAHVDDLADALEGVIDLRDGSPDDGTALSADATRGWWRRWRCSPQDIHDVRDMLADRLDAAFLTASEMVEALPRRLFDHLVDQWLAERNEPLYQAAVLLGVVRTGRRSRATRRRSPPSTCARRSVSIDCARSFDDPAAVFRDVYGWGTPQADLALLLDRLGEFGFSLGLDLELVIPPIEQDTALAPGAIVDDDSIATQPELRLPLVRPTTAVAGAPVSAEFGLSLYPSLPEAAGGAPGLALGLFGTGSITEEIALDAQACWLLALEAVLDLDLGVMVVARPGQPLRLVADPLGSATTAVRRGDRNGAPGRRTRRGAGAAGLRGSGHLRPRRPRSGRCRDAQRSAGAVRRPGGRGRSGPRRPSPGRTPSWRACCPRRCPTSRSTSA